MNVRDKVAVVTGGASGLGYASAVALAAAGARVVVLDRDAQAVASVVQALGQGTAGQVLNVTQDAAVEQAFEQIERTVGPVSVLVNCAGIADPGNVVRQGQVMPLAAFERVVAVNLLGTINCIRCAVPQMINARSDAGAKADTEAGVIINTASIAAFDGQIGQAAYAASKGGVAGMVLPLARELGDYGIRVLGIAPGVFETPMTLGLPQRSRDVVFAALPPYPQRPGQPQEFAQLVLAMLGNPMLNGEVVRLDGALRMPARL
ncbi:hypothetical protein Lal_00002599 [Lupinus albus]|nr:hypothetical protein Lal_00002599 [Lupinus albus]